MSSPDWDRVKALLADAADRPAGEREQYVRQHCDDPHVQREVLALLAAPPAPLSDIVSAGALKPGARVGAYIVERQIGSGGMGEVYRARDSRLERDVAIKVLPPLFAADRERLARFEREAKLLAALNHPHICTLFDVGREGDTHYLVMEYVEGESLADRLSNGPLPVAKVLEYGRQIADALARAHSCGIVHRDLKPANVMLTKSGAKLLDFGLARSGVGANVGAIGTNLATTQSPGGGLTAEGTLLGTCRYMAPEQVEGQDADARSDIWALGCVLYEMLTARPAFEGRTQASLIAAILERDPATPPTPIPTPPALEHVIRRCLAKMPEERWQSAADVRHELAWISESSSAIAVSTPPPPRTGARRIGIGWAGAAVAIVALAAGILSTGGARMEPPKPVMRLSLGLPEQFRRPGYFSISNDGQHVAFTAQNPKRDARIVWIRSIDAVEPRPLAGTEGERQQPFWSPDGQSLGFFADGRLKRIELATGSVRVICDAENGRGGAWGRDGTIVFAPGTGTGLYRVASAGGTPEPLTHLASSPGEESHRLPNFFSDGTRFVFTILGADGWYALAAGSTTSSRTTELLKWRTDPRYPFETSQGVVAGDFLLLVRQGSLFAQRLDSTGLRLVGDATPIVSGVDGDDLGRQAFALSANGTVVYRAASPMRDVKQFTWLTRTGQPKAAVWEPGRFGSGALAPDGLRVAVPREDPKTNGADIWIVDLAGGQASRLTEGLYADNPWWSADGKTVFFSVRRMLNRTDLHSVPADGSRPSEVVHDLPFAAQWPIGWDSDGSLVITAVEPVATSDYSLWSVDVKRRERPKRIFSSDRGGLIDAALSPDGRLVAWGVGGEVYLQPLRGGARVQVAAGTGAVSAWPHWRRDGRELYYFDRGKLSAVQVKSGAGIELGVPQALFDFPANVAAGLDGGDGQRFLMALPVAESAAQQPLIIFMNWMSGLR